MAIFDLLAYRPAAIFLSLISLLFPYASLSFPSCLARIILNSLLCFRGRNYSQTILVVLLTIFAAYRPNRPALHFFPNDLIGSHLNGGHRGSIEYKYPVHGHNIHSLATVNYQLPRGETLFHLPLTNILENIQRPFTNNPKIFKDFFACKFVLAANHQHPKIFKDFFACKIVLAANHQLYSGNNSKTFWAINSSHQQQQSTAATNSSNQQQQSTAAINSSNQQQQSTAATSSSNQQQQPKAATSNSNQQQQPAAAINSSNQKQRPATAINSSNQKQHSTTTINCSNNQLSTYQHHLHNPRRPTLDTITVPSSGYVLLEVDLGLATRLRVHLPPLPRLILVTFRFF